MIFDLDIEDYTIIQNAIHYYKHVPKRGNFKQYDTTRCEQLRDKLARQACPSPFNDENDQET